ncbi:MAG: aminopeptidase P family N-terminal domain-containing protein, partial [Candidatus Puniceispirillum sp.]
MAPAFSKAEYGNRLDRVRNAMQARDIEVLVIGDPSNMNWLTGFDAWSFYTPQLMLVDLVNEPFLMTRLMDAKTASFTTYLPESQVVGYPEYLVQQPDMHPSDYIADWMRDAGHATARIGYESDSYYFSPRSLHALQAGLPDAKWVDADLLVNWVRAIKSDAELTMMYQAAQIADLSMQVAWDGAKVGVRQCDL